jgi:two-component system sensor histidine kinase YesM
MRVATLPHWFLFKIITSVRHISIYKRLVVAFLLVIIIPNLVIGYVSFIIYSKDIEKEIIKNSTQLLDKINLSMQDKLKKYEDISLDLCLDQDINNCLRENKVLKMVLKSNNDVQKQYNENKKQINMKLYMTSSISNKILGLEIINATDEYTQINYDNNIKGIRFLNNYKFIESQYYKKAVEAKGYAVWFDTSMEKNLFMNQAELGYSPQNGVTLLRSIPDPDGGEPLGVIVMHLKLGDILDMNFNGSLSNYSNCYIISNKGLFYIFNIDNLPGLLIKKDIKNEIINMKDGSMVKNIDGIDYMVVFQESKYTSWSLVNITSRNKMLFNVYWIRNVIIFVTLLCILFAAILSYIVTVSISGPLKKLQKSMEQVDENNIEPGYIDTMEDEIGLLGAKFNVMILRIKNLIEHVYEVELLKKKEEIRRKEAELDALQMQINPHFLYNTLDIIRWEAALKEKGDGTVSQMIKAFADLLRLGTKKNTKLVTIEEELYHVKAYIKVMEFKKMDSINLILEVSEENLQCYITKLTLQPLVENAILHGLTNKQEKIIINISTQVISNELFIEVIDNGTGMDLQKVEKLNKNLKNNKDEAMSIGLFNVNERIKLFFGQEYGLQIYSQLGKGTKILIHIPYMDTMKETKGEQ